MLDFLGDLISSLIDAVSDLFDATDGVTETLPDLSVEDVIQEANPLIPSVTDAQPPINPLPFGYEGRFDTDITSANGNPVAGNADSTYFDKVTGEPVDKWGNPV